MKWTSPLWLIALAFVSTTAYAALPIPGTILQVSGTEGVSSLYVFTVDVDGPALKEPLVDLVDQSASVTLPGGRVVHGVVQWVGALGRTDKGVRYRLTLAPRAADLRLRGRNRVFREQSVPSVVLSLLSEAGQPARADLTGSYGPRPLVVQYQESDWDFVARLLEHEGIYFYFEHGPSGHTLVLSDRSGAAPQVRGQLSASAQKGRAPLLTAFDFGVGKHPGQVTVEDYDFHQPTTALRSVVTAARFGPLSLEEFPAGFDVQEVGTRLATTRLEERMAAAATMGGTSTLPTLIPGFVVGVTGHAHAAANQAYFVTHVGHELVNGRYSNEFTAVPASIVYRPPRVTPVPAAGLEVGFVTGPAGQEIFVDEFAQVDVRFPWSDQGEIVRTRVLQPSVESMWLPKTGDEVLVAFVDADPSRPVVLGPLFNGTHMPPYSLPDTKDVVALRARSTPGGAGTNEVFLGNRAGAELLRLTAAKDLAAAVANDQVVQVGRDNYLTVSNDESVEVIGDRTIDVGGDSRFEAKTLELTGSERIVLRVGSQLLVLDQNGLKLPGSATTAPQKTIPQTTAPQKTIPQTTTPTTRPTTRRPKTLQPSK